jgi:hypothetical protein
LFVMSSISSKLRLREAQATQPCSNAVFSNTQAEAMATRRVTCPLLSQ